MSCPDGFSSAPFLTAVAIGVPWFAAVLLTGYRRHARIVGCIAAFVSVVAKRSASAADAPKGESLYEALMVLFSCLTLGATLLLPRRDCTPGTIGGILFLLGSTLLAYSTGNLLVLLAAWILSTVPFLWAGGFVRAAWRPRVGLLLSSLALALAVALISASTGVISIDNLKGQSPGGMAAFGLLVAAVIFRKGICPAHAWVADAAEGGPAIPTALLLNGHFGALLVAKLIVPLFPHTRQSVSCAFLSRHCDRALCRHPGAYREFAPPPARLSCAQPVGVHLGGLESRTAEGITGALVHWFVVTVSTVGLFGILRLLEVRFGENLTASRHLGLAEHAPRLAVSFVVFGLALVGLPGTLSFCSQDLLIHGTLTSHPLTGLLLPIATAMNAVSVFRLFTRLFWASVEPGLPSWRMRCRASAGFLLPVCCSSSWEACSQTRS